MQIDALFIGLVENLSLALLINRESWRANDTCHFNGEMACILGKHAFVLLIIGIPLKTTPENPFHPFAFRMGPRRGQDWI